jgi:ABC-type transporter Mla subunit MlaD
MLVSGPGFFTRTTGYTVRFTDAPGLTTRAPVRRFGVKIGSVTDIRLDDERGIVVVKVAIDSPYRLRKSESATITGGLLGGDAGIDFVPKPVDDKEPIDREIFEPGAELIGLRTATVGSLLKGASEVVPTTQETLNDIRKSIQRLERLASRVEKTIPIAEDTLRDYRTLAQRATKTIPEVEKTNLEMQKLIASAREVVPEAQRTAEEYRLLAKDLRVAVPETAKFLNALREMLPTTEKALDEFTLIAGEIRKSIPQIRKAIDDGASTARIIGSTVEEFDVFFKKNREPIEKSIEGVQRSVEQIERTISQVQKIVDDQNVNNLRAALKNINTASEQFPKLSRNATELSDELRGTLKRFNTKLLPDAEGTMVELRASLKKVDTALADIPKLTKQVEGILNDVPKLTKQIQTALADVPEVARRINATLENAPESVRLLNKTLEGGPQAVQRLNGILADIPPIVRRVDGILADVPKMVKQLDGALAGLPALTKQIDSILADVKKISGPAGERGPNIVKNADEAVAQVNQVLADVRDLIRAVDKANGTLRKFLTDPSIYNNIDSATQAINRLIPRLEPILKDVSVFVDKLARHPETLGVGGAIRPSDGLKNPPTPPRQPSHQGFPVQQVPQPIYHPTFSPKKGG